MSITTYIHTGEEILFDIVLLSFLISQTTTTTSQMEGEDEADIDLAE